MYVYIIQAPLMIPLPFIIVYIWRVTEQKFQRLSLNLPYSVAVNDDLTGNNNELLRSFSEKFLRQREFSAVDKAEPYPYRINDVPLIDASGKLNQVYWSENLPEPSHEEHQ
jgi:hypothetical protein